RWQPKRQSRRRLAVGENLNSPEASAHSPDLVARVSRKWRRMSRQRLSLWWMLGAAKEQTVKRTHTQNQGRFNVHGSDATRAFRLLRDPAGESPGGSPHDHEGIPASRDPLPS